MTCPDLTAEASLRDGDVRLGMETFVQPGVEPVAAQVNPGKIRSLGRNVRGIGQMGGDQVAEEVPISSEVGSDLGEPVT